MKLFKKSGFVLCALLASACGKSASEAELGSDTQAAYSAPILNSTKIWKVKVAAGTGILNCRVSGNASSPVVFELRRGDVMDVLSNSRPVSGGFTWINVYPRGNVDHTGCFIAADNRFIEPANGIDANNLLPENIGESNYATTKTLLNCRINPGTNSAIVIADMSPNTKLFYNFESEFGYIRWSNTTNSYWVNVMPQVLGSVSCWVSAQKNLLSLNFGD